ERGKARNMTQFLLLQDSALLNREHLTRLFEQMVACVLLLLLSGSTLVVLAIRQTKAAKASELEATAAREEASRQRDRLESALDGAADPFVVSDREQRIVFANRAYRTLLPPGPGSFSPGTPLAGLLAAEAEMLAEGEAATDPVRAEFAERATRPGSSFVAHLTDGRTLLYRSHRSPEGGLVLTRTDLSERMRLERERAEYRDQFHHAMKMEAVGRLAGGIAHDFNNVLTAILTFSEMLADDLADRPRQQQMAQKVAGAAKRAAGLVKQILSFSRKDKSDSTEVDVAAVAKETIALLRATTPQTMRIAFEDTGGALIRADAGKISQVIMNLCVNARDAIGSRPGAIEIALAQPAFDLGLLHSARMHMSPPRMPALHIETDANGRTHRVHVGVIAPDRPCVCLSVRDSGGGIRRAVLEHMFEPFYTTKGIGQGSGLGLAAVHGIVLGLEGTIAVETTEGVGTEFRIFLPMAALARAA
ncbi:MAG: ATP-binding protein, partial [Dongia sp.]